MHNFKIGTISNGRRYSCQQHLSRRIHIQQHAGQMNIINAAEEEG
jgi:hypothetical protein